MSLRGRNPISPRHILASRILGITVFVVAFFLPACRDKSTEMFSAGTMLGWQCARSALLVVMDEGALLSPFFLAFMSGWVNPLIVLYLVLAATNKFVTARRVLAVAILVCMIATWIFFAAAHFVPLIGHILWIAGALLILFPEIAGHAQESAVKNPPEAMHL